MSGVSSRPSVTLFASHHPPQARDGSLSPLAHIAGLVQSLFFPPGRERLSALSEVSEALGCREGVGLQGEEVLLRQEEASALGGVRGLMELQLGVRRRVLEASRHRGGRRGGVRRRRRWRRRQSLRALSGSGG